MCALAPVLKACAPQTLKRVLLDLWPDTGWSNRVEYEPGTGALALFPDIHLETCDASVASVQVTVELETGHIGKGCDRDTYSEKSLHRLCGKGARESSAEATGTLARGNAFAIPPFRHGCCRLACFSRWPGVRGTWPLRVCSKCSVCVHVKNHCLKKVFL